MKKLIVAMLILSVCMFAGCDTGGSSSDAAVTTPVTPPVTPPAGNVIPAGAYYASFDGTDYTVYGEGKEFPAIKEWDKYLYGSYLYIYIPTYGGWSVKVGLAGDYSGLTGVELVWPADPADVTSVGLIEESVNGIQITNMTAAFSMCTSLTSLPADFTIPSGVTNMEYTFNDCTALTGTITVNTTSAKVTDYSDCFKDAGKETTDGITLVCADATLKTNLIGTKGDGKVE